MTTNASSSNGTASATKLQTTSINNDGASYASSSSSSPSSSDAILHSSLSSASSSAAMSSTSSSASSLPPSSISSPSRDYTLYILIPTLFLVSFFTDIESKRVLTMHPSLPISLTLAQFVLGVVCGWLLLAMLNLPSSQTRALPKRWSDRLPLVPIILAQCVGTTATSLSIGATAVSFTHTCKAAEPLFTAAVGRVYAGTKLNATTLLSLVCIILGVVTCSLTELSFAWIGLLAAMVSNFAFASRAVLISNQSKVQQTRTDDAAAAQLKIAARIMEEDADAKHNDVATNVEDATTNGNGLHRRSVNANGASSSLSTTSSTSSSSLVAYDPSHIHLDPISMYFYLCIGSCALLLPLFVYFECDTFIAIIIGQHSAGHHTLLRQLMLAGVGQWTYTLCSLVILSRTSALTHVVLNSIRRVYVIYASIYAREGNFDGLTMQNMVGTTLVLCGAFVFAREKSRTAKKQA